MLRKTLTNVVLPLNAIAAEIVAVGPCLSPLYTAHLWHFDQSPGLRNQTLRCSTTASSNRDFWFDHALEIQNICSNQSNADCQWQCRYKLTAGIKWYWLWSLSRCSGFTLHHWPSWQHMSQCWTGFLLTWTAPHWVQGMPLRLQKRKIQHTKESCNLINTITPLLHRFVLHGPKTKHCKWWQNVHFLVNCPFKWMKTIICRMQTQINCTVF